MGYFLMLVLTISVTIFAVCLASFAANSGTAPAPLGVAYTDNGNGTVTDPGTGLTWMRCAMGQTWTGSTCSGTANTYGWDQAIALAGAVSFAGNNDWRVPNIRELQTLIDRSQYALAIDTDAFPNTPVSYFGDAEFWSATAYAYDSSLAWHVDFDFGTTTNNDKAGARLIRLVRGGQSFGSLLSPARPTADYVDHGNGTVTHSPTGLMWQRCTKGHTWNGSGCSVDNWSYYTWGEAVAMTDNFVGYIDWRLPTAKELETMIDYTTYGPALNIAVFPETQGTTFWSDSATVFNADGAWYVHFQYGVAFYNLKSGSNQIRLVRTGQSGSSTTTTVSATTTTSTTTTVSTTTTLSPGADSVVPRVVAGNYHAIALQSDGSVWTWGANTSGQLGDGTKTDRNHAALVGTGYKSVAAGNYASFAVKSDDTLWAWGYNGFGQLGDGSTTDRLTPVQVGSGYVQIANGEFYVLALKGDGTLWGWGFNGNGGLGDGSNINRTTPVPIGSGYMAVATGGGHSIALKDDGSLWTWGSNNKGQLGDGGTTNRNLPYQVGSGYQAIAGGAMHTLAIKNDGTLWGWGLNGSGQLGNGANSNQGSPLQLGIGYAAVAAGNGDSIALTNAGTVMAAGSNDFGELGLGTTTAQNTFAAVGTGYFDIGAGLWHSIGVKPDGSVWAWGQNSFGEVGDCSKDQRNVPVEVRDAGCQPFTLLPAGGTLTTTTNLSLVNGWNLVSSLTPITAVSTTFASKQLFTSVWAWDQGVGKWDVFLPEETTAGGYAASKGFGSLTALNPGQGFWVNSNGAQTLTVIGSKATTDTISLSDSWNLKGLSSATPIEVATVFNDASKYASVWTWTGTTWAVFIPEESVSGSYATSKQFEPLKIISPGQGFWVNVKTGGSGVAVTK